MIRFLGRVLVAFGVLGLAPLSHAQVLDKQKLLDAQTFWDNRDWDWYKSRVPFFESPDADLDTTYYYRWELLTKHLVYGSADSGYAFTEFIDRPFWSGTFGAISCPAGHQLAEARWLRDPTVARDYARYWFRTAGAQPRNYSTWLADATWGLQLVHPDHAFVVDLLPDLKANYEGWERRHFDPEVGLFWQTGHDDGMEFNINSRQTRDILRGAPAYRPTINAYMYGDARAIASIARLAGDASTADRFEAKAKNLKVNLEAKLWDPTRNHFFPLSKQDEEKDGAVVKKLTLTYQTGKYAGDSHGRELIGFVPWQFGMVDSRFTPSWSTLMKPDFFLAPFGPTVTERHDPLFLVNKSCCWWSGQSWPYATSQTLVALANVLNGPPQETVSRADYFKLLQTFSRTHRKDGHPYLAEAADPDTGSFEGYDAPGHSNHYFHSGFVDPIITGLVGLRPRADEIVEVNPLAPDSWDYFALEDVPYHGHSLAIVWDRTGQRYKLGPGFHLLADGREIASSPKLTGITATLPTKIEPASKSRPVNYAVNNVGGRFPRAVASSTASGTSAETAVDGNYWYHQEPPNRWESDRPAEPTGTESYAVQFGTKRRVKRAKLYLLDDPTGKPGRAGVKAPERIDLERWDGAKWITLPVSRRSPATPTGHRANVLEFDEQEVEGIRAVLHRAGGARVGLTEFEVWGDAEGPIPLAPPPAGNLAYNPTGQGFPKASASFTSRFDKVEKVNDGLTVMRPTPHNRWTTYESPNRRDWLEIDFGRDQVVGRVELAIYDDGGGVQAPTDYAVEVWDGGNWNFVRDQARSPREPEGGRVNVVTFPPQTTRKLRVIFTHKGTSRSGLSEIEISRE